MDPSTLMILAIIVVGIIVLAVFYICACYALDFSISSRSENKHIHFNRNEASPRYTKPSGEPTDQSA